MRGPPLKGRYAKGSETYVLGLSRSHRSGSKMLADGPHTSTRLCMRSGEYVIEMPGVIEKGPNFDNGDGSTEDLTPRKCGVVAED